MLRARRRGDVILPRARSLMDAIRARQLAPGWRDRLMKHWAVGEGIAYIPNDPSSEPGGAFWGPSAWEAGEGTTYIRATRHTPADADAEGETL